MAHIGAVVRRSTHSRPRHWIESSFSCRFYWLERVSRTPPHRRWKGHPVWRWRRNKTLPITGSQSYTTSFIASHQNGDMKRVPQINSKVQYLKKDNTNNITITKILIIIIIIFLHGWGRLTCYGIDALPSFPGASTISSSSRFVFEGVFRESGVVHSFKVVDPVLFVFESHVLYSREL